MAFSWINQRLNDLENNINKDMELLNEFEEALRYETNPRIKAGYRKDIERQQESMTKYQQEYDKLKTQLNNHEFSTQVNHVGNKLEQMDSKLNLLLSGQGAIYENINQMQRNLLARYDESAQFIVSVIIQKLNDSQLILTQNLLEALETNQLLEPDIQEMIAILEDKILALPPSQDNFPPINEIIKDPELDAKHRLKVAIPIIPLLVEYEGEIELGSGFNIKSVWQQLKSKLQRN